MNDILALVTARGGSKGIPRKNIADCAGRPLIAWSIDAARDSRYVRRTLVSTDDMEIADIARRHGAEAPFLRPLELSGDKSPHIPVLLHALEWLRSHEGYVPEWILLLQPTSPLRLALDVDIAVETALANDASAVIAVSPVDNLHLVRSIEPDGRISPEKAYATGYQPRQAAGVAYAVNGAIFLVRSRVLIEEQSFYTDKTYSYVMPHERSLDVDTPFDLHLANLLLKDRTA